MIVWTRENLEALFNWQGRKEPELFANVKKNGTVIEGEVFTDPGLKVVCRLDDRGKWEATHALHNGMQSELPECFSLNRSSVIALNRALREKE